MKLPPLLEDRSPNAEMAFLVGGPIVLGIIAGLLLGTSEVAYLVVSVVGIAGGFFAGLEHASWREGFYRGLIGGLLFGVTILTAHGLRHVKAKADLPDPSILLVVITTVFGVALGALGGRVRARSERRRVRAAAVTE